MNKHSQIRRKVPRNAAANFIVGYDNYKDNLEIRACCF